ncbi:MAG: NACHT domain-containing protein, partial [Gammaproteobacteria bacterium]
FFNENSPADKLEEIDDAKQLSALRDAANTNQFNQLINTLQGQYKKESHFKRQSSGGDSWSIADAFINLAMVDKKTFDENEKKLKGKIANRADALAKNDNLLDTKEISVNKKNIPLNLNNTYEIYRQNQHCQINDKRVELYQLFKSDDGQTWQKAWLSGIAGIGKSTICQRLAYEWATQDEIQWQNKPMLFKEMPFKLVVWIKLRELPEHFEIVDLKQANLLDKEAGDDSLLVNKAAAHFIRQKVLSANLRHKFTPDQLNQLLATESANILYLLDGYDEIAGLAEAHPAKQIFVDNLLCQPNIIVTSRPNANLKHYPKDIRCLTLTGVQPENYQSYLLKHFQSEGHIGYQQLMTLLDTEEVSGNSTHLASLARITVNLEIFCTLISDSQEGIINDLKSYTYTELYRHMVGCILYRYYTKPENKALCNEGLYQYINASGEQQHYDDNILISLLEKEEANDLLPTLRWLAFKLFFEQRLSFNTVDLLECIRQVTQAKGGERKKGIPTPQDEQQLINRITACGLAGGLSSTVSKAIGYFVHLTIQEYFAAWYLFTLLQNDQTIAVKEPINPQRIPLTFHNFFHLHRSHPYYMPLWRFVAGLTRQDSVLHTAFFSMIIDGISINQYYDIHILTQCFEEIEKLDSVVRQKITDYIKQYITSYLTPGGGVVNTQGIELLQSSLKLQQEDFMQNIVNEIVRRERTDWRRLNFAEKDLLEQFRYLNENAIQQLFDYLANDSNYLSGYEQHIDDDDPSALPLKESCYINILVMISNKDGKYIEKLILLLNNSEFCPRQSAYYILMRCTTEFKKKVLNTYLTNVEPDKWVSLCFSIKDYLSQENEQIFLRQINTNLFNNNISENINFWLYHFIDFNSVSDINTKLDEWHAVILKPFHEWETHEKSIVNILLILFMSWLPNHPNYRKKLINEMAEKLKLKKEDIINRFYSIFKDISIKDESELLPIDINLLKKFVDDNVPLTDKPLINSLSYSHSLKHGAWEELERERKTKRDEINNLYQQAIKAIDEQKERLFLELFNKTSESDIDMPDDLAEDNDEMIRMLVDLLAKNKKLIEVMINQLNVHIYLVIELLSRIDLTAFLSKIFAIIQNLNQEKDKVDANSIFPWRYYDIFASTSLFNIIEFGIKSKNHLAIFFMVTYSCRQVISLSLLDNTYLMLLDNNGEEKKLVLNKDEITFLQQCCSNVGKFIPNFQQIAIITKEAAQFPVVNNNKYHADNNEIIQTASAITNYSKEPISTHHSNKLPITQRFFYNKETVQIDKSNQPRANVGNQDNTWYKDDDIKQLLNIITSGRK